MKASCTHLKKRGSQEGETADRYWHCANKAADRLWAVSKGKVVISENKNILNSGLVVIFQKPNGSIV